MKQKKHKKRMFSLSYKVFLTAVAISILPMLIVGTMLFTQSANIVKKNESAAKLNTLAHIGTNVETILQYVDDLSVLLIQDDIVRDWLKTGEEPDDIMDLRAKLLFREKHLKTYEIAELCGYQNYKYFSFIFKKYEKCSPRQFRENMERNLL